MVIDYGDSTQRVDPMVLYLISKYTTPPKTSSNDETNERFLKEMPLICWIYEAIVEGIIDYDYAPKSINIINFRKFANVSQEGVDDINDLRELGLIEKIQVTTKHYMIINAYRLTKKGMEIINKMTPDQKEDIDKLCHCSTCGGLMELKIIQKDGGYGNGGTGAGARAGAGAGANEDGGDGREGQFPSELVSFIMTCSKDPTHPPRRSSFLDIEDVSYSSRAWFLEDFT
ncbi:MAG: hypothetical protein ACTSUE_00105 [Promethearchaeota archaeon]